MQIRYFWVAVVHCRSFLLAAVLPRTTSTTNTTTDDDVVWALSYNCLFVLNSARLATHLWLQVDEHTDWSTILTPPPRRRSRNLHFIIPQQLLFRKKWLVIPTKHFLLRFYCCKSAQARWNTQTVNRPSPRSGCMAPVKFHFFILFSCRNNGASY